MRKLINSIEPKVIKTIPTVSTDEMFFYQDMLHCGPDVEKKSYFPLEERLHPFLEMIRLCVVDFGLTYTKDIYDLDSYYIYISAKRLFQQPGKPFNRPGWHIDGFLSNDINYVWSDKNGTEFSVQEFLLTQDHNESIKEMDHQHREESLVTYPDGTLLRITPDIVHRVSEVTEPGIRTFFKITFSKDRYNLKGNTINHLIEYPGDWVWRDRDLVSRNVPQNN